jgi:proteasome lid subunit RPN8/RPN11
MPSPETLSRRERGLLEQSCLKGRPLVPVKIPRKLIAEMISHALEQDPEECCGVLLGKGGVAEVSRRMKNVHSSRVSRYTMDPLELLEVQNEADREGQEFTAIYHSHTYTQAYPSETDIANAVDSGWTEPHYVLVSLVEKTRPIVRAFRIGEDRSVEETIILTDGQPYRGGK